MHSVSLPYIEMLRCASREKPDDAVRGLNKNACFLSYHT